MFSFDGSVSHLIVQTFNIPNLDRIHVHCTINVNANGRFFCSLCFKTWKLCVLFSDTLGAIPVGRVFQTAPNLSSLFCFKVLPFLAAS